MLRHIEHLKRIETTTTRVSSFASFPVKLRYDSRTIEVYAFLDEGSSVTIVVASVFQRLGVPDRRLDFKVDS